MAFKQFLTEISKQHLDKIQAHIDAADAGEERPFDDIFGNKQRIVIPLIASEEQNFQRELEKAGFEPDLKQGIAYSTVQTQRGQQKRGERIGGLLGKLAKRSNPEEAKKWQEMLRWWEKGRAQIGKTGATGVAIVISRHPIDIVRMSDHKEFKSCHSPGGSYFQCAVQEARTGGAVAYVVRNSDLATLQNLQAPEIFKDKNRKIQGGIEPLQRLRLRRFSDGETDLLVPEDRTYGIRHLGFEAAVTNWAKHTQRNKVDFKKPPRFRDFNLHGGSYQDTDADDLWNNFFGTHESGEKKSADAKEEEEGTFTGMEERADKQLKGHPYQHYHVRVEVEDIEETSYLDYDASVCFEFAAADFVKMPEESDMRTYWHNRSEAKTLGQTIRDQLDIYTISDEIYLDVRNGQVRLCLSVKNEDASLGDANKQLLDFERFLDDLDGWDKRYQKHFFEVRDVLVEMGFMKDWKENWQRFKHFKFDHGKLRSGDFSVVVSEKIQIGNLDGVLRKNIEKLDPTSAFVKFPNHLNIHKRAGAIFPKFIGDPEKAILFSTSFFTPHLVADEPSFTKLVQVFMQLLIHIPTATNMEQTFLTRVKYLDDNWDYFVQRAARFWEQVKPMLGGGNKIDFWPHRPIKVPRPPKPTHQQTIFPFKNEFRQFLTQSTNECPHFCSPEDKYIVG